jgi:hypothetical protein
MDISNSEGVHIMSKDKQVTECSSIEKGTFADLCRKHDVPEDKIDTARRYKNRHPELTDEQAILHWKELQLKEHFADKCRRFNVSIDTARSYKNKHPALSDEQVIQYYRPDLRINFFGELIE